MGPVEARREEQLGVLRRYPRPMPRGSVRRTRARRRWLTGVLLVLALIVAVPTFRALYQAFDLFGLPGALGLLLLVAAILAVAWLVHLFRTYGAWIAPIARSIARSFGEAFAANLYLAKLGPWLRGPARLVRRRLSRRSPNGLFLTVGVTATVLLLFAFASITTQVLHHGAL